MSLAVERYELGLIGTNSYIVRAATDAPTAVVIDPADGRVVAEKLTDNLGYAIFEVPAGSYTIKGIGGEPQTVVVSPGQTAGFKLIVH